MQFTQVIASAVLLFAATGYTAPVPQLAGEGAAANSLLSGTDNAIGYGTENAENKLAGNIASITGNSYDAGGSGSSGGSGGAPPPPPPPHKRQLAGEGAAANSLLSGTDNAVGYGIENAENKLAGNIASITGNSYDAGGSGSSGGSGGAAPPPPPPHKRQLDKIANGAGAIGQAAGVSTLTAPVVSQADTLDGTLTSGAADAGAQLADTEVSTAEAIGNAVPKTRRQLDKIANGAGAIGQAAGVSTLTAPVVSQADTLDGTLTSGAADAGAQLADIEVSTAEAAGNAVP